MMNSNDIDDNSDNQQMQQLGMSGTGDLDSLKQQQQALAEKIKLASYELDQAKLHRDKAEIEAHILKVVEKEIEFQKQTIVNADSSVQQQSVQQLHEDNDKVAQQKKRKKRTQHRRRASEEKSKEGTSNASEAAGPELGVNENAVDTYAASEGNNDAYTDRVTEEKDTQHNNKPAIETLQQQKPKEVHSSKQMKKKKLGKQQANKPTKAAIKVDDEVVEAVSSITIITETIEMKSAGGSKKRRKKRGRGTKKSRELSLTEGDVGNNEGTFMEKDDMEQNKVASSISSAAICIGKHEVSSFETIGTFLRCKGDRLDTSKQEPDDGRMSNQDQNLDNTCTTFDLKTQINKCVDTNEQKQEASTSLKASKTKKQPLVTLKEKKRTKKLELRKLIDQALIMKGAKDSTMENLDDEPTKQKDATNSALQTNGIEKAGQQDQAYEELLSQLVNGIKLAASEQSTQKRTLVEKSTQTYKSDKHTADGNIAMMEEKCEPVENDVSNDMTRQRTESGQREKRKKGLSPKQWERCTKYFKDRKEKKTNLMV